MRTIIILAAILIAGCETIDIETTELGIEEAEHDLLRTLETRIMALEARVEHLELRQPSSVIVDPMSAPACVVPDGETDLAYIDTGIRVDGPAAVWRTHDGYIDPWVQTVEIGAYDSCADVHGPSEYFVVVIDGAVLALALGEDPFWVHVVGF